MTQMKHLSIVDGAFLHMESAEMPMHVGSLNLFEPPAGYSGEGFYEAVKAHVAKRMHLAPVFTRKLALMPFDLANPVWIHDDDIDLDYHVRYMVLPKPGNIEQLEALAARLALDAARPQPPALGVLRHRGAGRRAHRLLRKGASRGRRRPGRRRDGDQHVRPLARAARREATARRARQHLPARCRRAARGRAAEPVPAARAEREALAQGRPHRDRRGAGGDRDAAQRDERRPRRAQGRGAADALQARAGDAVQPLDHQPACVRGGLAAAAGDQGHRQGDRRRVDQRCRPVALLDGAALVPEGRPRAAGEVARRRRADLACGRKATPPPTTRLPAR